MKMKMTKEWLEELPEPIRTQAITEFNKNPKSDVYPTDLAHAIAYAFDWAETEYDYSYWEEIYQQAMSSNILIKHQLLSKLSAFNPKRHTSKQIIDEMTEWAKNIK